MGVCFLKKRTSLGDICSMETYPRIMIFIPNLYSKALWRKTFSLPPVMPKQAGRIRRYGVYFQLQSNFPHIHRPYYDY